VKSGDIVRFAKWTDIVDINDWSTTPKSRVGLLVEYDSLNKSATILYRGQPIHIRAQLVEKAGKKDFEKK
jgi:hypothetical protein|tara:strand:+ start:279 stop:488 length:210 start_codon:yes stop_codon:yes gene_type:complete